MSTFKAFGKNIRGVHLYEYFSLECFMPLRLSYDCIKVRGTASL